MHKEIVQNITYRPLEEKDLPIRTKWLQNPLVKNNLGWQIRKGTSLDEQKNWFNGYKDDENDQRFMIELNGESIGMVGLSPINPVDKNAMLYVVIGEDEYRGKGIGRKACEFIIDYGFNKLGLHRIYLEVSSFNESAYGLYSSLGFVEEGRFKEQIFLDGKYYDEVYMGLINKGEV